MEQYPNYKHNAEVIRLNMHDFSSVNIHSFKGAVNRGFKIKKTTNFNYTTSSTELILFITLY